MHFLTNFSFQIKRVNPEKACYLEYDKLYVDSKIFIWNDALGQVIEQAEAERYGTYSLFKVCSRQTYRQCHCEFLELIEIPKKVFWGFGNVFHVYLMKGLQKYERN